MGEDNSRVEFSALSGIIEIRYFDTPEDQRYRSWKLPVSIVNDLIAWRKKTGKQKDAAFPLNAITKVCEITMNTHKYIEIKSLDCKGRTNMTGWSLPACVVDDLSKWRANNGS